MDYPAEEAQTPALGEPLQLGGCMVAAALRCLLETGERVRAKGTTSVFGGSGRYDSEAEKAVCLLRPPSDSADYSWPDFETFWPQLACPAPEPSQALAGKSLVGESLPAGRRLRL